MLAGDLADNPICYRSGPLLLWKMKPRARVRVSFVRRRSWVR